jgi:hypothetical protein
MISEVIIDNRSPVGIGFGFNQWGHAREGVEKDVSTGGNHLGFGASMGPRP